MKKEYALLLVALFCMIGLSACTTSGSTLLPTFTVQAEPPFSTPVPISTPLESLQPTLTPTETATITPTFTPTPGSAPELVASYPIQGDRGVRSDLPLRLVFDQPIDLSTANLTFQPLVEGTLSQSDACTLVFTPSAGWPDGAIQCTLNELGGTSLTRPCTLELSFSCSDEGVPLPVLMYHHLQNVDDDSPQSVRDWVVSPQAFTEQMAYLVENDYHSISPNELAAYFLGEPLPTNPIIITIDDGYRDVYTVAWPILQNTSLRPVIYISPEYIGCSAYLTREHIIELAANGFTIGVHGYDHSSLVEESDAELVHQILDARDILQAISGQSIGTFCYPYGAYNNRIIQFLQANGYTTAFTLNNWYYQSYEAPYMLNRLRIDYSTSLTDLAELLDHS